MQNNKKYSLILIISAFILGAPAFFFSQADEPQELTMQADTTLFKASDNTSIKAIQTLSQLQTPAADMTSPIAMRDETAAETNDQSPIQRIKEIQNKSELHQSLIEDHEKFTRYPAYNQVFSESEKDPVAQRYDIDERTTQSKEDETSLTIWSNKKYYLQGDQATIYASLRDTEGKAIKTEFIGQVIYNEKDNLETIEFSDANQDGIYEHSISLDSSANQTLQAGLYKVLIVNKTNQISDAVTFILSKPEIELTGNFRDSLSANNELLIQAEVLVSAKNRYYFQASLYSANKLPIGSTQMASELLPGTHWITLPFDGSMIKDIAEPAPFLLKNLSLAKVSVPMQRAPLHQPEYFTQDYALTRFSSNPQAESDKL